jgi:hypothetical protein
MLLPTKIHVEKDVQTPYLGYALFVFSHLLMRFHQLPATWRGVCETQLRSCIAIAMQCHIAAFVCTYQIE